MVDFEGPFPTAKETSKRVRSINRRRLLALGGGVIAVGGLAALGIRGNDQDTPTANEPIGELSGSSESQLLLGGNLLSSFEEKPSDSGEQHSDGPPYNWVTSDNSGSYYREADKQGGINHLEIDAATQSKWRLSKPIEITGGSYAVQLDFIIKGNGQNVEGIMPTFSIVPADLDPQGNERAPLFSQIISDPEHQANTWRRATRGFRLTIDKPQNVYFEVSGANYGSKRTDEKPMPIGFANMEFHRMIGPSEPDYPGHSGKKPQST